eukprot:UN00580
MHFDKSRVKISQSHTSNSDKVFGFANGLLLSTKMQKSRKSASKNKHPIKLRFLIWRLQSANPEKK